MRKNIYKTKKYRDKFRSGNRCLNWKILNYFNEIWNWNFSTYGQNCTQTTKLKPTPRYFLKRAHSNPISFFVDQKILKDFNDFQNQNFPVYD